MELMSLGEKNVYFVNIGDSNNGYIISSSAELALENQKQQLIIELKAKELALQAREIAYLKELLDMYKREKS